MSEMNPGCPSCKGGDVVAYISDEDTDACLVCGGTPRGKEEESVKANIISARLSELLSVMRIYQRQLAMRDPLRGFSLDRLGRLVNEVSKLDQAPLSQFVRNGLKKGRVDRKVNKNGPAPTVLPDTGDGDPTADCC